MKNEKKDSSPCAVIICALALEYLAVRAHLTSLSERVHEGSVYEYGYFLNGRSSWEVGIVEAGMGGTVTASAAERAINYFKPAVILFVGIAGGLKDVRPGDVVAATKVYGYESGKAGRRFETRPDVGNSTHAMQERAKAEARNSDWLLRLPRPLPDPRPRVFVAPIAAGEKVITSTHSKVHQFLATHYTDAVAVEMEGHGFLKATHSNQHVEALVIRGISDLIDNKSLADASGSQELAAKHASAFAFEVLAKLTLAHQEAYTQSTTGKVQPASNHYYNNNFTAPVHQLLQGEHPQVINGKEITDNDYIE